MMAMLIVATATRNPNADASLASILPAILIMLEALCQRVVGARCSGSMRSAKLKLDSLLAPLSAAHASSDVDCSRWSTLVAHFQSRFCPGVMRRFLLSVPSVTLPSANLIRCRIVEEDVVRRESIWRQSAFDPVSGSGSFYECR